MIIDSHAHMGKGFYMDDPIQSNIPPERILKMSREAGVDKTIVFPVNYPEYSGAMKEIYEAVQKYPNELIGYAARESRERQCPRGPHQRHRELPLQRAEATRATTSGR